SIDRRNQHALRAVSPRTPTPVLLPLLRACSFRLGNGVVRVTLPLGLGSVAPLLPPAPAPLPSESLRLPSPTPNRSDTRRSTARPKDSIDASAPKESHPRQMKSGGP